MRYVREFTPDELAILENDLVDVKDWIDKAIEGKLNQCRLRIRAAIVRDPKINVAELAAINPDVVIGFVNHPKFKRRNDKG